MTTPTKTVVELTSAWDEELDSTPKIELPGIKTYAAVYQYLRFLATRLYGDFERDLAPDVLPFLSRVDEWILGAKQDDDRRTLLEAILSIRYVAREEVNSLYQMAYRGHLTRWLLDTRDVEISKLSESSFDQMVRTVWIGSASDSFHLDTFFHITSAPSATERRPSWLELAEFAKPEKVADHMRDRKLERVAIFEDFVGSGTQIEPAIRFALSLPNEPEILVCPVFACADSLTNLEKLISHPRVTYDPVVMLAVRNLLPRAKPIDEPEHLTALRECLARVHTDVDAPNPNPNYIHGFRGVGSLLVQYSNTPDNCPPALWQDNTDWTALFPRKPRGGHG